MTEGTGPADRTWLELGLYVAIGLLVGMGACSLVKAVFGATRDRTAVSTTTFARPAVRAWQYATFNAENRVTAICMVLELADSSLVYVPFADSAFAPVRSVGASCSVPPPERQ